MSNPVGLRFGRFTVIKREPGPRYAMWRCRCECGNERVVDPNALRRGSSKSCGCLRVEVLSKLRTRHGHAGKTPSIEYRTWQNMKERCLRPKNSHYKYYGKRGVFVCDRWANSFEAFMEDMGPRPGPDYSIDRLDNNGPYAPENCRWATRSEQARNKSGSRIITCDGVSLLLVEWSERTGLPMSTILSRITRGSSIRDALNPVKKRVGTKKLKAAVKKKEKESKL